MTILADIASGEVDTADLFFLFAIVLAVVAAIAYASRRAEAVLWAPVAGWLAVACLAVGLLVL